MRDARGRFVSLDAYSAQETHYARETAHAQASTVPEIKSDDEWQAAYTSAVGDREDWRSRSDRLMTARGHSWLRVESKQFAVFLADWLDYDHHQIDYELGYDSD